VGHHRADRTDFEPLPGASRLGREEPYMPGRQNWVTEQTAPSPAESSTMGLRNGNGFILSSPTFPGTPGAQIQRHSNHTGRNNFFPCVLAGHCQAPESFKPHKPGFSGCSPLVRRPGLKLRDSGFLVTGGGAVGSITAFFTNGLRKNSAGLPLAFRIFNYKSGLSDCSGATLAAWTGPENMMRPGISEQTTRQ